MKKFDLERARAGDPVCVKGGPPAEIKCFDSEVRPGHPLYVEFNGSFEFFRADGICESSSCISLVMAPKTVIKWVNVYREYENIFSAGPFLHSSKLYAESSDRTDKECVGAFPVEIEL